MSIEVLKERARRHEQREEWQAALDLYRQAINQQSADEQLDIGLWNRVGDLQTRLGNLGAAVEGYEKAVDLYLEAELFNNAIAVCKKIVRHMPLRNEVYLKMGKIRVAQGFLVDARQNFLTYAERMQAQGELDEAFRALIEFADLAPEDMDIRMAIALQLEQHERTAEAIEQLTIAYVPLRDRGAEEAEAFGERLLQLDPEVDLASLSWTPPEAEAEEGAWQPPEQLFGEIEATPEESEAQAGVVGQIGGFESTSLAREEPAEAIDSASGDDEAGLASVLGSGDVGAEEEVEDILGEAEKPLDEAASTQSSLPGFAFSPSEEAEEDYEDDDAEPPPLPLLGEAPAEVAGSGGVSSELFGDEPSREDEEPAAGDLGAGIWSWGGGDDEESEEPEADHGDEDAESDVAQAMDSALEDARWSDTEEADAEPTGDTFLEGVPGEEPAEDASGSAEDTSWIGTVDRGEDTPDDDGPGVGGAFEGADEPSDSSPVRLEEEPAGEATDATDALAMPRVDLAEEAPEASSATTAVPRTGFHDAMARTRALIEQEPDDASHRQRLVDLALHVDDTPTLIEAYLGLAGCLDRLGEGPRSRAIYQQVLNLDAGNLEATTALGGSPTTIAPEPPAPAVPSAPEKEEYIDLGAMIFEDDDDEEGKEKSTRFVVAYEEPTGDEEADFARMLRQFKQKVSENVAADDVKAHHDLGTAYKEMGLLDEAIEEYQAALRGSASHLPTYELLGQCFMEKGMHEAAVSSLSRALGTPNSVEDELVGIMYYLGRAHEELGNTSSALEYYDRVFALDINFADVTERLRALR